MTVLFSQEQYYNADSFEKEPFATDDESASVFSLEDDEDEDSLPDLCWASRDCDDGSSASQTTEEDEDEEERTSPSSSSSLHRACQTPNADAVRRLLLEETKDNANIDAKDEEGKTALHLASLLGHVEIVLLLLAKDANIEARDGNGKTALTHACGAGHFGMVQLLVDRGADVNATN